MVSGVVWTQNLKQVNAVVGAPLWGWRADATAMEVDPPWQNLGATAGGVYIPRQKERCAGAAAVGGV